MDRRPILTVALVLAGVAIGVASFCVAMTYVPPPPPPCDAASIYCDDG